MMEIIKKSMLAGIGLALKTKEEVEELARGFVKRGELTETEGRKLLAELILKVEESKRKLESKIEKIVKDLLKKADVVTKEELNGLKKEIRELKKILNKNSEETH